MSGQIFREPTQKEFAKLHIWGFVLVPPEGCICLWKGPVFPFPTQAFTPFQHNTIANSTLPKQNTKDTETLSKKSPTGPTERTPKPEYLIALATYLGVRW